MPTYSYKCTECGNAFDIQQAFSDASLTECPVCGGRLRKVFGAVGVSFNGSGFYRTDSRAAEPGAKKDADKGAKKDAGTGTKETGTGTKDAGSSPKKSDSAASGAKKEKKSAPAG